MSKKILYLWCMNNRASYTDKKVVIEMIAAFHLYTDEGMAAVERMYPQHTAFVRANVNKTRSQVKKELLKPAAI